MNSQADDSFLISNSCMFLKPTGLNLLNIDQTQRSQMP
jgi:hypothetical protein